MLHDRIYRLYRWCSTRKKAICLIVIFLALGRFFYLNYINWTSGELCSGKGGIQYSWDSDRYISGAAMIENHQEITTYEYRNIGYILLIALSDLTGLGLSFVIMIQLIIALCAALAVYDIARSITNSRLTGLLASLFCLVNPFITQWHLFIQTESLYASLLIISAWSVYKAASGKKSGFYLLSFIIVSCTASLRPNGWVLIPIFFLFAITSFRIGRRIKAISVAMIFLAFFLVVSYGLNYRNDLKDVNAKNMFIKGEVVWGHPETSQDMPEDVGSENSDYLSVFSYMAMHPAVVGKIAFLRISSELLPLFRSWISAKFIIRFLLWMLPLYFLSLVAFLSYRKNVGVRIISAIIISHLCIIGLTCADQEFRFLTYILPQFCVVAALGLNATHTYIRTKYSRSKEFV